LAFSGWLFVVKNRPGIDISDPLSLSKPFFPINRFPLRAWLLTAFAASIGGAVGLFATVISPLGDAPFDRTLIGFGLPLLTTTLLWTERLQPKR
jgi:hypothetical protein